uniref:AlNc14C48G3865 protein n=1 Tax=Albugo laibachii Nc14 TaxID=890382 RepID=F0WB08_9STRA|nr:AlNc14C48G3865 [Albugo laibachii Nc14]CCA18397.1 AlNc14C50G3925 [Albugo laibachii Nc14]|eukprot:CCA18397.1 AlNc14C50G3925 [Albugo laibachii Nc14]
MGSHAKSERLCRWCLVWYNSCWQVADPVAAISFEMKSTLPGGNQASGDRDHRWQHGLECHELRVVIGCCRKASWDIRILNTELSK